MAELTKKVRLVAPGGKATPAPPLGPILGSAGVNIGEFTNQFNEATQDKMGEDVSVVIHVFDDRTFNIIYKTAPTSSLIKKAAGIKSGSGKNKTKSAGSITEAQLREIAETKMPDLNCTTVEQAMEVVKGQCVSMGIEVK